MLLKKQSKYEERLDAGGSLNYIEDAYRQIAEEEKRRAASKQKLTALEKNRMAILYTEMREEGNLRNSLVEKFRISKPREDRKRDKIRRELDKDLNAMNEEMDRKMKLKAENQSSR